MDPRNFPPAVFIDKCLRLGFTERKARRILGAAIGKGDLDPASWTQSCILAKVEQSYFPAFPKLTLEHSKTSAMDGFQKLLFRTQDGLAIETVLIPLHKQDCVSICISSQVGCVMGCDFCATAKMKERRNLKTWEIVDQLIQARELVHTQGRTITGVVFMGMGEPFLNYKNVITAAEIFSCPVLNAISAKAITVSTVGIVPKIDLFTKERRPFRLSISLGSAIDEKRAFLVPVAARTPIRDVMDAARRHAIARNDRVMLSYVCISGINMNEEDAIALGDLIGDTPVRLNLIEVTDTTGKYTRPTESEMSDFRDALTKHVQQPVARRYSGGADIQAACGTLAGD